MLQLEYYSYVPIITDEKKYHHTLMKVWGPKMQTEHARFSSNMVETAAILWGVWSDEQKGTKLS